MAEDSRETAMSRWILALDQGTTSSRSILFDHDGNIVESAQREFTQFFPQTGWVEHDANEIWNTQRATIEEVLKKSGATSTDVAAVGITNQRETTVLWDRKTGEPIAPAIVWQDRRTAEVCATLRAAGHEPEVTRRTGLLLDPYFSGTKLAWLLDHVPGARDRAMRGELCFGTIDTWLTWKLSGGAHHVTDVTNASRTLLLNLSGEWDEWMLNLLRIPKAVLPRVLPSSFDVGIRIKLGQAEVPLTGLAGDQQSALFGQACLQPGMAKNTYGTGCFMLMHTGNRPLASTHRLLTTVACSSSTTDGRPQLNYALEGSVFVGGAVVQWLRDGLGFVTRAEEIEALASSVPDHGG
ncbi:MAG: glycerol kinase GlpK, partial [Gammaproteobacteria bacterium]|nr:glycerol kinase GlpK [Gammaproteobacteria bacterium]